MKNLINRLLDACKKYTPFDYAFLKITLISLGILFGTYCSKFFLSYTTLLWSVFIVSFIWVVYKTFFKYIDKK